MIVTVGTARPQSGAIGTTLKIASAKLEKPGADSLTAVSRKVLGPAQAAPGTLIVTVLVWLAPGGSVKRMRSGVCVNPSSGNVGIITNVEGGHPAESLLVKVIVKVN